jgi:DNA-binding CsgD family transcriptional regulator
MSKIDLTNTEYEILLLLAQNPLLTNKQIASERQKTKASGIATEQKNISEHTVASHIRNILTKLRLESRYLIQSYAISKSLYCPNPNCKCVDNAVIIKNKK